MTDIHEEQAEHRDPAIGAFLDVLHADIRGGNNIGVLPAELAEAMIGNADEGVDLDEDIDGEVAL